MRVGHCDHLLEKAPIVPKPQSSNPASEQDELDKTFLVLDDDDDIPPVLTEPKETNATSPKGILSRGSRKKVPFDPSIHSPLPARVTLETLKRDLDRVVRENAKETDPLHHSRWNALDANTRKKIAHARLIKGKYGKLAYGDPGHPGFAATLIRSAIHLLIAITIHTTRLL
jgi:hypothetical protein